MIWFLISCLSALVSIHPSTAIDRLTAVDVSGKWKMEITGGNISRPETLDEITLEIQQSDTVLTGRLDNPDLDDWKGKIEGKIIDGKISFSRSFVSPGGLQLTNRYEGKLEGETVMSGELKVYRSNGEQLGVTMQWKATRNDN